MRILPPLPAARPKPLDFLLAILIVALSIHAWRAMTARGQGNTCVVYCDGTAVARYDLHRPGVLRDTLETVRGLVLVETRDLGFRVVRASCPNKVCVNRGFIRRQGESIVCVPNRLVALIPGKKEEWDARTY